MSEIRSFARAAMFVEGQTTACNMLMDKHGFTPAQVSFITQRDLECGAAIRALKPEDNKCQ